MSVILKALDAPRRREILRLVWDDELAAGEIATAMDDVTFGAVSQHLRVLEDAGLIAARKEGRRRLYIAKPDELGPFRTWLESMWDDALYRLKLAAELEESRRGPRPTATPKKTRKKKR